MNINYNHSSKEIKDNYFEINNKEKIDEVIIVIKDDMDYEKDFEIPIKNITYSDLNIIEKDINQISELANKKKIVEDEYESEKSKLNDIIKEINKITEEQKNLEQLIYNKKSSETNILFCGLGNSIFKYYNENETLLRKTKNKTIELNSQKEEISKSKNELDKKLTKIETSINHNEKEIINKTNILLKSGFSIDSLPFTFANFDLSLSLEDQESIEFRRTANMNKIKNIVSYIDEATTFVEKNKNDIIKEFCNEKVDIDKVTFKFKSFGGETHNGGKSPFLITFFVEEPESTRDFLKIVYKPRDSLIDIEVLKLISDISKQKEELNFPKYKIISYKNTGSLWEFISGDTLNEIEKKNNFYSNTLLKSINEDAKIKLLKTTIYLDNIFKKINLTDLNPANIIVSDQNAIIYPIDLEAFDKNETPSGFDLIINKIKNETNEIELTTKEIENQKDDEEINKLIEKFNFIKEKIVKRYVPISTTTIQEKLFYSDGPQQLSKELKKELTKQNFKIKVGLNDLENFLSEDRKQGDVPYFTLVEDIVYYGLPESKRPIAKFIKETSEDKEKSEDIDIDN